MRPVRIGCSGWNYPHWRERVYPTSLPARHWLEYYASLLDTVEVNSTNDWEGLGATHSHCRRASRRNIAVVRTRLALVPAALLLAGVWTLAAGAARAQQARGAPLPRRAGSPALPFRVRLIAPTHAPKVNAFWRYSIRVTDLKGRPIPAKTTVQVIDPLGTAHPAQYDNTSRNIVNWPLRGAFRDYVQWPAEARGVTLVFRVTVVAKGRRVVLSYNVTPQ